MEIKEREGDTRTGHWSGEIDALPLDDRLLLVSPVVEDSPSVYNLSASQLPDRSFQVPYDLAQPRERSPIKAVAVHYDK